MLFIHVCVVASRIPILYVVALMYVIYNYQYLLVYYRLEWVTHLVRYHIKHFKLTQVSSAGFYSGVGSAIESPFIQLLFHFIGRHLFYPTCRDYYLVGRPFSFMLCGRISQPKFWTCLMICGIFCTSRILKYLNFNYSNMNNWLSGNETISFYVLGWCTIIYETYWIEIYGYVGKVVGSILLI